MVLFADNDLSGTAALVAAMVSLGSALFNWLGRRDQLNADGSLARIKLEAEAAGARDRLMYDAKMTKMEVDIVYLQKESKDCHDDRDNLRKEFDTFRQDRPPRRRKEDRERPAGRADQTDIAPAHAAECPPAGTGTDAEHGGQRGGPRSPADARP